MNDELVTRYNNLKKKQQDFDNQKIQVQTQVSIKEQEVESLKAKLVEMGVTDFDNLDAFIQTKREAFNAQLKELEAKLNG